MIVQDAKVILVEVKSGSSGKLRSLHSFIDESGLNFALRLYSGPKSIAKNETPKGRKPYTLVNLPLYYAGRLIRKMDWTSNNPSASFFKLALAVVCITIW